eukprot:TRINITY_DN10848_c0_g1_i1.p1 TRINITY_DN10848_c0_g1~~TRINITY_DN10848_c0_g1_i1.p1  ORF type:complete len:1040 (+),score=236.49 TRINITY_DN10848_c0_g1_i1:185-3304(+)
MNDAAMDSQKTSKKQRKKKNRKATKQNAAPPAVEYFTPPIIRKKSATLASLPSPRNATRPHSSSFSASSTSSSSSSSVTSATLSTVSTTSSSSLPLEIVLTTTSSSTGRATASSSSPSSTSPPSSPARLITRPNRAPSVDVIRPILGSTPPESNITTDEDSASAEERDLDMPPLSPISLQTGDASSRLSTIDSSTNVVQHPSSERTKSNGTVFVRSRSDSSPAPCSDLLEMLTDSINLTIYAPKRKACKTIRATMKQFIEDLVMTAKRSFGLYKGEHLLYSSLMGIYFKEHRTIKSYVYDERDELEMVLKKDKVKTKMIKVVVQDETGAIVATETIEATSLTTVKGVIQSLDKKSESTSTFGLFIKDKEGWLEEFKTLKSYGVKSSTVLEYKVKSDQPRAGEYMKLKGVSTTAIKVKRNPIHFSVSTNSMPIPTTSSATSNTNANISIDDDLTAVQTVRSLPPGIGLSKSTMSVPIGLTHSLERRRLSAEYDNLDLSAPAKTPQLSSSPTSIRGHSPRGSSPSLASSIAAAIATTPTKVRRLSGKFSAPPDLTSSSATTLQSPPSASTFLVPVIVKIKTESTTKNITIYSTDATADVWKRICTEFALPTSSFEEYKVTTSNKKKVAIKLDKSDIFILANNFKATKDEIFVKKRRETRKNRKSIVSTEVLQKLLDFIEANGGMQTEGIFRISGNALKATVLHKSCLQNDPQLEGVSIHDVSSALKMYLRESPEPVIPFHCFESFIEVHRQSNQIKGEGDETKSNEEAELNPVLLRKAIRELPENNRNALKIIISFLSRLSENSQVTLMDADNLGKVFGPTILRKAKPDSKDNPLHGRPSDLANRFVSANIVGNVAASLIKNYHILEEETAVDSHVHFNGTTSVPNLSTTTSLDSAPPLSSSASNIGTTDIDGMRSYSDAKAKSKSSIFGMFGRGRSKSTIKIQDDGSEETENDGLEYVEMKLLLQDLHQLSQKDSSEVQSLVTRFIGYSTKDSFRRIVRREVAFDGMLSLMVEMSKVIAASNASTLTSSTSSTNSTSSAV